MLRLIAKKINGIFITRNHKKNETKNANKMNTQNLNNEDFEIEEESVNQIEIPTFYASQLAESIETLNDEHMDVVSSSSELAGLRTSLKCANEKMVCLEAMIKDLEKALKRSFSMNAIVKYGNSELEQLLKQKEYAMKFPIKSSAELEAIDKNIRKDYKEYLSVLRNIVGLESVTKKLGAIIEPKVLLKYNYDGIDGKKPFKQLKNLNSILLALECTRRKGYGEAEYVKEIRLGIKRIKRNQKKHYRAQ